MQQAPPKNLVDHYLSYMQHTESPYNYHRWCIISGIAALLGRSVYTELGQWRVFPNNFYVLVGEPASRKSTAIILVKKLLADSGFSSFAASKTTREKFFLDLAGIEFDSEEESGKKRKILVDRTTDLNLWGEIDDKSPKETLIAADELTTFFKAGNMEFFDDLGQMWDWDSDKIPFEDKVKNSKSVRIFQPTINILSGTTSENFNRAFPPETLGTGFMSRLVLIAGKRSNRRYAFPKVPTSEEKAALVDRLASIRGTAVNNMLPVKMERTADGERLLEAIYLEEPVLNDTRFAFFQQRRFTHLLKLCLPVAIALGKLQIDEEVAIVANTYLTAAEFSMPNAIGEFGKSKLSDVANKIVTLLDTAHAPMDVFEIWKHVHKDLSEMKNLSGILDGLQHAKRIQHVPGKTGGFLPMKEPPKEAKFVDWSLLTEEEREFL